MTDAEFEQALRLRLLRQKDLEVEAFEHIVRARRADADAAEQRAREARADAEKAEHGRDYTRDYYKLSGGNAGQQGNLS